jgi:hypothetical protein
MRVRHVLRSERLEYAHSEIKDVPKKARLFNCLFIYLFIVFYDAYSVTQDYIASNESMTCE